MAEEPQASSIKTYTEAELNQMFCYRYTSSDEDFMKTVTTDLPPPPCVHNWYSRPKRTFDFSRNEGRRTRGNWEHDRGYGSYNRHRDQDRTGPSRTHYAGQRNSADRHHPYRQGYQDHRNRYQQESNYQGGYSGQRYQGNNNRQMGDQYNRKYNQQPSQYHGGRGQYYGQNR